MRIRVKICGITREQDAVSAAEAGADALGFVHWARSPRAIDAERARQIAALLPPFVSTVALFVDPSADEVRRVIDVLRPDLLQFHGEETPAFCSAFGVPYIKALAIDDRAPDAAALGYHAQARGLLLDSHDPQAIGGTGRAFDWTLAPHAQGRRIVLAGGLNADNVARAITLVRPWAVDVSSGVESAPGIKDEARVRAFMRAVAAVGTN